MCYAPGSGWIHIQKKRGRILFHFLVCSHDNGKSQTSIRPIPIGVWRVSRRFDTFRNAAIHCRLRIFWIAERPRAAFRVRPVSCCFFMFPNAAQLSDSDSTYRSGFRQCKVPGKYERNAGFFPEKFVFIIPNVRSGTESSASLQSVSPAPHSHTMVLKRNNLKRCRCTTLRMGVVFNSYMFISFRFYISFRFVFIIELNRY